MIKQIDADIYSINETHLNQNDCIEVESYKWIGFNRCSIHKDAPKASGGIGILIKNSVVDEYLIESIDKSYDGILAIKFMSKQTDFGFVVISGYLPPENSVWGRDSQEFFSHALSLVYIYNECDAVFLCGDLNSRIGSLDDTSDFDDINIPCRKIIDKTTNQHVMRS